MTRDDVKIDRESVERVADLAEVFVSFTEDWRHDARAHHKKVSATLRALLDAKEEAEAERDRARADAMLRRHMNAPEDPHVEALCNRYGYGAVMDAASRLWSRKDPLGAFYIGGCIGMKTDDEARAALQKDTDND